MSQEWYYSVDGDRQGPVAGAELKKLADAGTLKPTDLVWKDGMADWAPAKSIKGLFAGGSAATPKAGDQPAARTDPDDEAPAARPAARSRDDEDEEDDDRPARRRRDDDDEDEEDRPARSRRRDEDDEDDEDDDRPIRRRDSGGGRPKRKKLGSAALEEAKNKKMVAGLLGILLGGLAIHKFYLGYTGTAVIQLILSIFTCGLVGWIGLIEGIIYLTKSDEDFYRDYIVNQKQWF